MEKSRHVQALSIISVALIVQLSFIAIFVLPYAQVLWDEAEFLLWIHRATLAIRSLNIEALTSITWQQIHYPPLQSLLFGTILAPFGFSVTYARLVSLMISVVSTYSTYLVGYEVAKKTGNTHKWASITGLIAALLFMSSPILIILQSIALKESLVILFSTLITLFYIRGRASRKFISYCITGLLLALLFYTKYEPAGFIAIALSIDGAIVFLFEKEKIKTVIQYAVLLGIPVLLSLPWVYGTPDHTGTFFGHLSNSFDTTGGIDILTNILFYPRAIVYSYGATLSIGVVLLAAWITSLCFLKKPHLRSLFILFTTNVLLLAPRFNNLQDRYLAITIISLYTLTATHAAYIIRTSSKHGRIGKTFITVALAVLVGQFVFKLPQFPLWVYGIGQKAMFTYAFNQLDANLEWFNYEPDTWGKRYPWESKEKVSDVLDFITYHVDPHVPAVTHGRLAELSPPYIYLILEMEKTKRPPGKPEYSMYYITFTVIPGSRYYTEEYRKLHEWVQWEVIQTENDSSLVRIAQKEFPEFGFRIGVYGRPL